LRSKLDILFGFCSKRKAWFLAIVAGIIFYACNPSKKLLQHQYIVNEVSVENVKETNIPKENFEAFFRQKPNRKLFRKIDFFVWWYNRFDDEKMKQRRMNRNAKYDEINAQRIAKNDLKNKDRIKKGKKAKQPKLKDKESSLILESIRDIGEPAVILDSSLTELTRMQLSRYLFSKGYFNNRVKDSVKINANSKRAQISYFLYPGKPYIITSLKYDFEDPLLGSLFVADSVHSFFKRGEIYDDENRKNEIQRLTNLAANNGYYYFENAYLDFVADSGFNNQTLNITTKLRKYSRTFNSSSDSIVFTNHPQLKIQNVFIVPQTVFGNIKDVSFSDTLRSKRTGFVFLLNEPLQYRRRLIMDNIEIHLGDLFNRELAQKTYKQLLGLGVFKNVTIQFLINPDNPNKLDCYIICNPLIRQSTTSQIEGTNTSGNLGIDGSILYQNRNTFRGGELAELKLQGSIAAQTQFNTTENDKTFSFLSKTFNTIQFGPEFKLSFPRAFFPFSLLPFKKEMSPRTYIKSEFNYQARPEFNRTISSIDYGFNFRSNNGLIRHDVVPFEVYFVKASLSSSFRTALNDLNDAFLVNSFQDHITTVSKYVLTYISKENSNTSRKPVNYVRWSIQSSGNILRKLYDVIGHKQDSLNRYLIAGIPFAQFLRTDVDYRHYIPIRKKTRAVFRFAAGIGKPLKNLNVLPYEQSFFSGGPNSIRAWRARTLGPGGYDPSNSSARFDKIGDLLLETNFEYRFHIIKSFNGALFVDAGNIWRLNADASKPNGEFLLSKFADQIAIGTGFGLRWDLSFLVLRLDLAAPIKDPKFVAGNRWTFDKQFWEYTVANFGIGYPF
jgi:outer membrane translocation and assembly module TamA